MKLKLLFLPRYHANPNTGERDFPPFYPPLSTATLKSFMEKNSGKHNFEVEQDDLDIKTVRQNMDDNEEEKIHIEKFFDEQRIDNFFNTGSDEKLEREGERIIENTDINGYDVIGLSLMPTDNPSTAGVALAVSKKIKERTGSTVIMGGSVRMESKPEENLLRSGYIDYRILGSPSTSTGEYNLLDFCQNYESGNIEETSGLVWIDDGKYRINHVEYDEQLKSKVTLPNFEGLPIDLYRRNMKQEIDGEMKEMELLVFPFFFIRSCPHNCTFCSNSRVDSWGSADPSRVADRLEEIVEKYSTDYFFFHNTTINPTYDYAENFAEEIMNRELDIQWSDCANFSPLDRDLLTKLKKAGACRLVFGFESASPNVLNYIKKTYKTKDAEKVLRLCDDIGIWTELDMICGFPYESKLDVETTINFLERHKDKIDGCYLNKFWIEGQFKEEPEKYGIRLRETASTHINWSSTPFDEIYGQNWEDKVKKTEKTYNKIQNFIEENFDTPPHIHGFFFKWNKGSKYQDISK